MIPNPWDVGSARRLESMGFPAAAGAAAGIERIVSIGAPVNVLALPGTPPVSELAALGVRRISTGGAPAYVAYKAAEVADRM